MATAGDIFAEALRWPLPDADVAETEERILDAGDCDPDAFRQALRELDDQLQQMPGHPLLAALRSLIAGAADSGIIGWAAPG